MDDKRVKRAKGRARGAWLLDVLARTGAPPHVTEDTIIVEGLARAAGANATDDVPEDYAFALLREQYAAGCERGELPEKRDLLKSLRELGIALPEADAVAEDVLIELEVHAAKRKRPLRVVSGPRATLAGRRTSAPAPVATWTLRDADRAILRNGKSLGPPLPRMVYARLRRAVAARRRAKTERGGWVCLVQSGAGAGKPKPNAARGAHDDIRGALEEREEGLADLLVARKDDKIRWLQAVERTSIT